MKKHPEITAKTRQAFIDAFWKIITDKGLHKITVSELTREAGYNRGTFYEYFKDIPDLLEQIEDEIMEDLIHKITDQLQIEEPFDLNLLSQKCAAILMQYDDKIFYLLSEHGDSSFTLRFKQRFIQTVANLFDFKEKDAYKDYIIAYCYSALVGLRLHWYETGKQLEFDEVVKITQRLIATGLFGFIGKDYIQ